MDYTAASSTVGEKNKAFIVFYFQSFAALCCCHYCAKIIYKQKIQAFQPVISVKSSQVYTLTSCGFCCIIVQNEVWQLHLSTTVVSRCLMIFSYLCMIICQHFNTFCYTKQEISFEFSGYVFAFEKHSFKGRVC